MTAKTSHFPKAPTFMGIPWNGVPARTSRNC
jgi:hypothetical protein